MVDEKNRWVEAAGAVPLSSWARKLLNEAALTVLGAETVEEAALRRVLRELAGKRDSGPDYAKLTL